MRPSLISVNNLSPLTVTHYSPTIDITDAASWKTPVTLLTYRRFDKTEVDRIIRKAQPAGDFADRSYVTTPAKFQSIRLGKTSSRVKTLTDPKKDVCSAKDIGALCTMLIHPLDRNELVLEILKLNRQLYGPEQ